MQGGEDCAYRRVRTGTEMDYLVNIANVLYLASYYMQDLVRLRVLSVVAAGTLVPYFWFRPDPMLAPVVWNLFFIVLNLYWLARSLRGRERRPAAGSRVRPDPCPRPCAPCP